MERHFRWWFWQQFILQPCCLRVLPMIWFTRNLCCCFFRFWVRVLCLSWARQTDRNLYAYRTYRILRITSFACNTSPSAVYTAESGIDLSYLARWVWRPLARKTIWSVTNTQKHYVNKFLRNNKRFVYENTRFSHRRI